MQKLFAWIVFNVWILIEDVWLDKLVAVLERFGLTLGIGSWPKVWGKSKLVCVWNVKTSIVSSKTDIVRISWLFISYMCIVFVRFALIKIQPAWSNKKIDENSSNVLFGILDYFGRYVTRNHHLLTYLSRILCSDYNSKIAFEWFIQQVIVPWWRLPAIFSWRYYWWNFLH